MASNVLCEPEASELPALMWIKDIAIGCPHVPPGRSAGSAFQHELPRHELDILFADRACRRTKAGMGTIGTTGPFTYVAVHLPHFSRLVPGMTHRPTDAGQMLT